MSVASVFTRIIAGELPGRLVWRDTTVVALLSINPLAEGHVLVVPIDEVDHWLDLDAPTWAHVTEVSRLVGLAVQRAFDPPRVAQMIAGFEVPHVHVHIFPAADLEAMSFANADPSPDPLALDAAAERIRSALRELGHAAHVAG
jgi:histidine triad (HIT) family protein